MGQNNNVYKKRIALFHYSSPPYTSGVDVIIRDQARLFRLNKYKVEIVAGIGKQFRKDIPVHIIKKMSPRHPATYAVLKELEQGLVTANFIKLEKNLYNRIKKFLTQNNIEVCIFHNLFTRPYNLALTAALSRIIADFSHIQYFNWIHDVIFYNEPDTKLSRDLANAYPWNLFTKPIPGLTYVCVSNFLKNDLVSAFKGQLPKQLAVIPNGHDIEKFFRLSPPMRQLFHDINGLHSDLIACLPVRAIPRKNLELALQITKAFVKKGVKFKLLLTANIDYKRDQNLNYYQQLKNMAKDLKIAKNVFFLEEFFDRFAVANKPAPVIPIPELFLISDFLLVTSHLEGFGLPILEAGLMRCPIFATDIPALREIGTTNINYFSSNTPPDQIADFITETLKKMPQAYFYKKIIKKYSLRTIFQKRILPLIDSQKR